VLEKIEINYKKNTEKGQTKYPSYIQVKSENLSKMQAAEEQD
jgi:hypothetical protein